MIYRIVGRFNNTEYAQTAAKRTTEAIPEIYEIRLYYRTGEEESGFMNNIRYSGAVNAILNSNRFHSPGNSSAEYDLSESIFPFSEMSDECLVSVMTSESFADEVRSIMYNCGGFDVTQTTAAE